MPYNSMPEASAPRTKYFIAASDDSAESRFIATSAYVESVNSSSPRYTVTRLPAETSNMTPGRDLGWIVAFAAVLTLLLYTTGVLSDLTGAYSSAFLTTEKGIKAYVNVANANGGAAGHKISYVMGDTTSTAAGAVTAAQRMVQSDKVDAIIDVSALYAAAQPFLLKNKIPVIGKLHRANTGRSGFDIRRQGVSLLEQHLSE